MRGVLIVGSFAALTLMGCGHAAVCPPAAKTAPIASSTETDRFGASTTFRVDKAALRAGGMTAKQMTRLEASAFRYSRMLAGQFEARTCWSFRDVRWHLPVVAVHGDAHLEQFVVTNNTFGVEDFDKAGYGPAVVDLVRYSASIELACREATFPCDPKKAVDRYFTEYRASLDKMPDRSHPPTVVERMRRKAPQRRAAWLDWVDAQMGPLTPEHEALARKGWKTFADLQIAVVPDRSAEFYEIARVGELRMGVGSALERKILVRIRGPSNDPNDDVVLEARAGEAPGASGCVWRPAHGSSLHVLTFMALLGPRMPEVFGYVDLTDKPDERPFWVQAWHPGYVELTLDDIHSQDELEELAVDAARQLAGHFWTRFVDPLRGYQRYAQLRAFDTTRERAVALSSELAREVIVEWDRFRKTP